MEKRKQCRQEVIRNMRGSIIKSSISGNGSGGVCSFRKKLGGYNAYNAISELKSVRKFYYTLNA